jgi:hypothetical protein
MVKDERVIMKKDEKLDKNIEGNKRIYVPMTNDEIKKLAEDMYKGLIFTDRHMSNREELQMVFIPLALADKWLIEELIENPPGMIYEYLDEASPREVNGMPMFFSFKMASIDDTKKVFEHYHKIKEAVTNA